MESRGIQIMIDKGRYICFHILIIVILLLGLFVLASCRTNDNDLNKTDTNEGINIMPISTSTDDVVKEQQLYNFYEYEEPDPDIKFIDDIMFKYLKSEYDKINFNGEFLKGDLDVYDYYKKMFLKLLNEEMPFIYISAEKRTPYFLSEYENFVTDVQMNPDNLRDYTYRFFDMDGDGTPELFLEDEKLMGLFFTFKYLIDTNEFINSSDGGNIGSGESWRCSSHNLYTFKKLDKNNKLQYSISYFTDYRIKNNAIHLVGLPYNADEYRSIKITYDVKKQGYYDLISDNYFFRVTYEQYNELTNKWSALMWSAQKNIQEVTYTFDELFGDLMVY